MKGILTDDDLTTFIKENQNAFYILVYSYVKNREEAYDIIQDSIYKAFKKKHLLKEHQFLKTWFYRILINTSINYLRKQKRFIDTAEMIDSIPEKEVDVIQNIDLYEAIDRLDHISKMIIMLRFFEDMKIDEVADILNMNVSTVKSRIYSSLKKLKVNLEGDTDE